MNDVFASDPNLERALELVRSNHEEAKKFVANPEHYLQSKGINTEGLKFTGEIPESELEAVSGGISELEAQQRQAITVCGGVGAFVCGSVGG